MTKFLSVWLPHGSVSVAVRTAPERMATDYFDASRSIFPRLGSVGCADMMRGGLTVIEKAVIPTLLAMHAGENWGSWDADGREVES